MTTKINPRDAESIIRGLEGGIVPSRGIRHLLVGRKNEVLEIIDTLDYLDQGGSDIRFWVGDFGSGKSFMLRTIESMAIQRNFVASTVDLTPSRRFYATDKKAKALYKEIVDNMATMGARDGGAIEAIVGQLVTGILTEGMEEGIVDLTDLDDEAKAWVRDRILDLTTSFKSAGLAYELGEAIYHFFIGEVSGNRNLKLAAIRWIRGDIDLKMEARRELGLSEIINDDNWFDALKTLVELFRAIGYGGLVVNFDEAVNLYKLPMARTRERNYERILNIYNECKSGAIEGLFVNFGATRKTVFDESRGMSSYGALKGRLGSEESMDSKYVNTNRTALGLKPLSPEEIYTLLDNLRNIYSVYWDQDMDFKGENIRTYMELQLNRPGADEFLTPRAVIKDFLEILDIKRQNQGVDELEIIQEKFGSMPIYKDQEDLDDLLEVF